MSETPQAVDSQAAPELPNDSSHGATQKTHRLPLYGAGVAIIALLSWLGFVYPKTVLPDPGTLYSVAELHLGMAQLIPAEKDAGQRIRQEHLVKAREALAKLERKAPGLAITREMHGFACWIDGKWDDSLAWYEKAMAASTKNASYHDRLRIKRAQVLVAAGRTDEARKSMMDLAVVSTRRGVAPPRRDHACACRERRGAQQGTRQGF